MPQLHDRAAVVLEKARTAGNGRCADQVVHDGVLRQTVMGLRAGTELSEQDAPPAATLQLLHGRVRVLKRGQLAEELVPGALLSLTGSRHSVEAIEHSVFLLTTVSGDPGDGNPRVA
ncbi:MULTISPECIES: cupin domain-containing protein [Kocuria]|jgi:hypothetical protein|uniref:cupin n=1 Tax=Kocuria TaxID=57493 RepID=UPI00203ADA8F|nr:MULTISPECIES: cupin [Kocuria]MCM3688573.1 cupin [Kocuria rosea]HST72870.1 cupin [Kocuria rosea]